MMMLLPDRMLLSDPRSDKGQWRKGPHEGRKEVVVAMLDVSTVG